MNNLEKFNAAFTESFGIPVEQLPELVYQGIEAWDSVGHMQLIAALEDTFEIMFDTDDIIGFNSYQKGKELIAKYEVEL